MKNNNEILESNIDECNQLVITGIEGSVKSRSTIEYLKKKYCDNGKIVVLCYKSYSMASEKQNEYKNEYGFTDNEIPIMAGSKDKKGTYTEYHTNPENPNIVPLEAKIIIVTQKFLNMCYYKHLEFITGNFYTNVACVVSDEVDFLQIVSPNAQYEAERFVISNFFKGNLKVNEKMFEDWFKHNRCAEDRLAAMKDRFGYPISHWINDLKYREIKVIILTSEKLPTLTLKTIGFNICELNFDFDFSTHIIKTFPCSLNTLFFDRINEENKWNDINTPELNFKYIISDRYENSNTPLNDLQIINHSSVRGSNILAGNIILTLLSSIPDSAIDLVKKVLNYYDANDKYNFEFVKKMFYRDRLMQAVGRSIGPRGIWKGINETYLYIHFDLYKLLKHIKTDTEFNFPYTIEEWEIENPVIQELLQNVSLDMVKVNNNKYLTTVSNKQKQQIENELKYKELFEIKEGSRVTYEEVKLSLGTNCHPKSVGEYFGCESKKTTTLINGKMVAYRYIKNLSLKSIKKIK